MNHMIAENKTLKSKNSLLESQIRIKDQQILDMAKLLRKMISPKVFNLLSATTTTPEDAGNKNISNNNGRPKN